MPKVEYIDETHQYFIDGVEVPSVSKLVSFAMDDDLSNINPEVLKKASEYGTSVHNAIEQYEKDNTIPLMFEEIISSYNKLKTSCGLEIESMEQIITDGKNYAGRYDILAKNGILYDIKTNSRPMIDKWSWQLSLYYYALKSKQTIGYVIYLPKKGKPKLIEIPIKSKSTIEALLKLYEEYLTGRN